MATTFAIEIVTPEGQLFSGQVQMAKLPGLKGSFGVMAHHAPLLSALDTGVMELVMAGGDRHDYAIGEGFVEIGRDGTRVLTDFADESGDIDQARARKAETRARERIQAKGESFDRARAEASLRRALMRMRVKKSV